MQPVEVTFQMRTPMIVPPVDKHFDALLSWAAVQQADFDGHENPITVQHDTGLARHEAGEDWCFMASVLDYEWIAPPGQVHYIKRSRLDDYAGAWDAGLFRKKPYFDGQRGTTKAGSYLQPTRWAKTIKAFAVVEDMHRFEALLPWITHIGKLAHKDFGAVASVHVQANDQALHLWKRRNLPTGSPLVNEGYVKASGGLCSPYWDRSKHRVIATFAQ